MRFVRINPAYRCEEGPVTFQVGMLASDGVLLASDTLVVQQDPITDLASTARNEKITIVPQKSMAYCCAGDELASAVGNEVARAIDQVGALDFSDFLHQCVEKTVNDKALPSHWHGGSVLVVPPNRQLWRIAFDRGGQRPPEVRRFIAKFVIAGDIGNYASFYLERHFPDYPRPKPKLAQLVRLAAHTVLNAGLLGPREVGGLDIVLCSPTGFERLPEDEIQRLETLSGEVDEKLRQLLGIARDQVSER